VRRLVKHALPTDATPVRARNVALFVLDYEPSADRLTLIEAD